jgi:D-glucosaminate-6-phosphate ammonia-lyase
MMVGSVYHALGTRPVVNALGIYTDLGGSRLSPAVWAAMEEANRSFAGMVGLLEGSGKVIAGLLGTEAARVTPGASAAIALGTAACMTGTDGAKMEQLPDTTGMKAEVVMQRNHRYKYDRMVRLAGARIVEAGDAGGTTLEELDAAIGAGTAMICLPAHLDGAGGTVRLPEVAALARRRGVPVLVDAAYLNYPVDLMGSFTAAGADLVCFSAKYFGGPNGGGFIAGRADLIDAVAGVDFTRFESGRYLIFGRPFKLDRQIVVGVVAALREWLTMDHAARFAGYGRLAGIVADRLAGIAGVRATPMFFSMQETLHPAPEPVNCLVVEIGPQTGTTAEVVEAALAAQDPAVLVHLRGDSIVVDVEVMNEAEAELVADRLAQLVLARG